MQKLWKVIRASLVGLLLLGGASTVSIPANSQVNVVTWHNDVGRTGQNTSETALTQAKVSDDITFGKVCSYTVDGQVYAQPLVVTNVKINGTTYSNVVYVATMNDSVYAFQGTSTTTTCNKLLGPVSLLNNANSEFAANCGDFLGNLCPDIYPAVGILSTPVIVIEGTSPTTTGTIYVVANSECSSCNSGTTGFFHRIHALDITTLSVASENYGGPQPIFPSSANESTFSEGHVQRPALLYLVGLTPLKNMVYVAFSMSDGASPLPPGWVFGFEAEDLTATPLTYTTIPSPGSGHEGAGIWQGGGGLAAGKDSDSGSRYIYLDTANGTYNLNSGGSDAGDSFLKLTTDLSAVADYFTPYTQFCQYCADNDFGSGGVMLIPDDVLSGSYSHVALGADKLGNIYAIDRGSPGEYSGSFTGTCGGSPVCSGTNPNLKTLSPGTSVFHNTGAYWNLNVYYGQANDNPLRLYQVASSCSGGGSGPLCSTSVNSSPITFKYGVTPSVSSNGTTSGTGIVWAIWTWNGGSGGNHNRAALYAFNPSTLADLYNTDMCSQSGTYPDRPGGFTTKFSVPTIANGFVYIGTQSSFDIYGLIPTRTC